MPNRLPPLKALRAFEAAGRLLSLSKAADELHVTPGAVSQQVKLLEDFLSARLFKRVHRQILLTDTGKALLPGLSNAFDQIITALDTVKEADRDKPVTVSVVPSLASKWLVPRLRHFSERHPEIEVRIETSHHVTDLVHSDIDMGIRFGKGQYPGLRSDLLFCQEVFPVCSPKLLEEGHPLKHPSDLRYHKLLHNDTEEPDTNWPDWEMWLLAAGVADAGFARGPVSLQYELLIEAVLQGQGIALLGSVPIKDDLSAGRLVKPFELAFQLEFGYYIVSLEGKASHPRIAAFREWLLDEAAEKVE